MNYRAIATTELTDFAKETPAYSLGEVLYSILRTKESGCESLRDIKNLTDEQLYNIIENVRESEKPENL